MRASVFVLTLMAFGASGAARGADSDAQRQSELLTAIKTAPVQAAAVPRAETGAVPACVPSEPDEYSSGDLCSAVAGSTKGFKLFEVRSPSAKPREGDSGRQQGHSGAASPEKIAALSYHPARTTSPSALDDLMITFELGSAQLTPEGIRQTRNFAKVLLDPQIAGTRFQIAGHTDATGTEDRNRALSQARAEAVRDFLVAQGVDKSRLEAKGYGSEQLAIPQSPENAANRRVQAVKLR